MNDRNGELRVKAPLPHPHLLARTQEEAWPSFCFFGRWRCTSRPPRISSTWPCSCLPSPALPRLDPRPSVGLSWWTPFSSCAETGAFISVSSLLLTALWIYNRREYVKNWMTAHGWQPSSASEIPHLKASLVFQWGCGTFCIFQMEFSSLAVCLLTTSHWAFLQLCCSTLTLPFLPVERCDKMALED